MTTFDDDDDDAGRAATSETDEQPGIAVGGIERIYLTFGE